VKVTLWFAVDERRRRSWGAEMTLVSNPNSTALLILQKTNFNQVTDQKISLSSSDLAAASISAKSTIRVTAQPSQAESKIAGALYSVNSVSVTEMKLDLIDRTGKALGVNQEDYASRDEFVDAMRRALGKLKIEGGMAAVIALEKELGLDKLGVSVDDVIASAADPDSNDKLTKALKEEAGILSDEEGNEEEVEGEGEDRASAVFQADEIGLYSAVTLIAQA
jgi:hypothetical protein